MGTGTQANTNILTDLSPKATKTFAETFLQQYLTFGFQSLGKRDIELLLFYALEQSGINEISPDTDNYSVAKTLRLPPSRVASLRRDAYARWDTGKLARKLLKAELKRYFTTTRITSALKSTPSSKIKDGLIPVQLENPAVQEELLHVVKESGSIPHLTFNKEVTYIHYNALVAALEKLNEEDGSGAKNPTDSVPKEVEDAVRKIINRDKGLSEYLKSDFEELKNLNGAEFRARLVESATSAVKLVGQAAAGTVASFLMASLKGYL